jgi:LacI family transcriptional regulator
VNTGAKRVRRPTLDKSRKHRVTLADVAAKAGVSVATASVAITGRPSGNCRVSPPVAERVRLVAREMGYRPNLQARNLSTRRTHTVAILIKRAAWHNAMFYVAAAQRILRQRGYVETFMLHPDDRLESEREHLELCIERQVEGIIAMPVIDLEGRSNLDLFNRVYREEGIPIVQLGLALPECAAPSVTTDETEGSRKAITLLHAMGHRRIAHLTIKGHDNPEPFNPFRVAHLRYLGYRAGVRELGLGEQVFSPEEECTEVGKLFDCSFRQAAKVAKATPRPTALLAFSDFTAAGLMAGLAHASVSVPGDVSILGIDDQPFSRMLRPALSTLAPPFERMGELATQTLLKMIDGGKGASTSLPPALVMRDSISELHAR